MSEIIEQSALYLWKRVLATVLNRGTSYVDRRKRTCIELRNVTLTIKDTTKGVAEPITILSQFEKWIYPDLQEVAKVILSPKSAATYEYSYGKRLFAHSETINQIDDYIVPLLEKQRNSRQAVASLFDVKVDRDPTRKETPAIMCFDFKIREDKLHVACFIRSCDLFIGLPANIYQVYVVQQYVAHKLGIRTGDLTFFCTSAHIFKEYEHEIQRII